MAVFDNLANMAEIRAELDTKVTNSFQANIVPYANANGKLVSSSVTDKELARLSGVTGGVQNQLDGKLPKSGGTMTGNITTCSVIPSQDNAYHLGTSGSAFQTVKATHLTAHSQGSNYIQASVFTVGTENTLGYGRLLVGNSTPKGTAGNARGQILVYDENGHYVSIVAQPNTVNPALNLPTKSGTIPVASLSGTTLTINF